METQEKFEQIKNIVRNNKGINISRVPDLTKEYFFDLAEKEFESDRGMCLKMLCDLHKGYFPTGHEEIEVKIDFLAKEIAQIKQKIEDKKEIIKTLSGRIIERRRKNE